MAKTLVLTRDKDGEEVEKVADLGTPFDQMDAEFTPEDHSVQSEAVSSVPAFESTQSPLYTPPDTPQKGKKGGRPRNDGGPVGLTAPSIPIPVPRPRFSTFKSDATNNGQRPKSFFNWWNLLPTWAKDQTICYVYRDWPYLLPPPAGTYIYIDKISGSEPLQDETDLLNRYGCGRYRLIFNVEKAASQGDSKTLATVYITGLSNDMRSFPPADQRVSDVRQVDLTHPDNRSYVSFLRIAGKVLPGENTPEKEEDMANVQVVEQLTGLLDKQMERTEKATEAAVRAANVNAARPQQPDNNPALIEMMTKATEAAIGVTVRSADAAIRKAEAISTAVPAAAGSMSQKDPLDVAMQIVQLMNVGKGNDALLEKFMEQSNKQMERMEVLMKDTLARVTAPQQTPVGEAIKGALEYRKLLRELREDDEDKGLGGAAMAAAGEVAPKWLAPLLPYAPLVGNMLQGFFQTRPAAPMPMPGPGAGSGMPMQQGYPGPQSQPWPPQPAPGPQLVPNPTVQQVQPDPATMPSTPMPSVLPPEAVQLLTMIRVPFIASITDRAKTGTDFAGWFIDGYGQETYDQVIVGGAESVSTAIRLFPPIMDTLAQLQVPEVRFSAFVAEFCDPQWDDEDEKDGDKSGNNGKSIPTDPAAS